MVVLAVVAQENNDDTVRLVLARFNEIAKSPAVWQINVAVIRNAGKGVFPASAIVGTWSQRVYRQVV